ncbi:ATPase [Fusarium mundagurra]|uniref:ATPase n=1 Tax=Fusarium mundagurra TaxID=1567541 RepID=A0A8H5XTD8_9HYPO|nr:ATPase [Fusarium mundagurra]
MDSDSNDDQTVYELTPMNEKPHDDTEWAMKPEVVGYKARDRASGFPDRELGVTWTNLSVDVIAADAAIQENSPLKTILDNSHGCVKPGEMLLVLGRPGSGCTTLLNMIANMRRGYAGIKGDVHYGSMIAEEAKNFRGQIVMNSEEEVFYPALTVGQTMDFASRLNVPFHLPEGVTHEELRVQMRDFLLRSMGIQHTVDTKVGDAFIRGVSGGERKRVSIIETLATQGLVFCWDNSTRGLDASFALEYTKAIRAMTDVLGLAFIVTLYQAGNGIYELFDKVLVLDEGKEVYYGPVEEAKTFMESTGFICQHGANVADYLTGVTVPTERQIHPDYQQRFPRTADALRAEYEKSPIYEHMRSEYDYPTSQIANERTKSFKEGVRHLKDKRLPDSSPMTVGFIEQTKACIIRQYQIVLGDKVVFFIKQFGMIVQALIAGSLFYNATSDSSGLFIKSGAVFFAILANSLIAMSEVTDSFTGRPVLLKHKAFAMYHPAAFCIAQIAADIPIILLQVTLFSLIEYFMVGLTSSAGHFFTFWILLIATTICITALFRAIGAAFSTFDAASKASGFVITATLIYSGYFIHKPLMHDWFVWMFWVNPMGYAFDALLSNEFHGKIIPCVGHNLVPSGPGFNNGDHQACAGVGGAKVGQNFVTGDDYLASLSYSHTHLWRNFGIIWAWWVLYVAITIYFTSKWHASSEDGPSLLIPREHAHVSAVLRQSDEEGQTKGEKKMTGSRDGGVVSGDETDSSDSSGGSLVRNTSVFTWKNLTYTVKTPQGDRVLLDNVQGWVRPGMLGALMGSSGAGKTTLLDVLAQRKTEGTIHGSIMVDGRLLPLKYVDTIIDLLELHDLAHTLIGQVGAGLSVEQRKRVTIGVELVSKLSILIFLDEPTSGLDGQSAYNTVRFLRKLAAHGQAILVTIHQPSAQLFSQFDTLLLLSKGGKTVYFGDIGEQAKTISGYFGRYGAPCPEDVNPAEHMIDVVSGHLSQGKDWNQVWLSSPEHEAMEKELDHIISDAASKPPGTIDDGHEFVTSLWEQIKLVTYRMNVSLYCNIDYVNNKFALHVILALYNGFTFWQIGSSVGELQHKLFTIFNFIFVAPGVIA